MRPATSSSPSTSSGDASRRFTLARTTAQPHARSVPTRRRRSPPGTRGAPAGTPRVGRRPPPGDGATRAGRREGERSRTPTDRSNPSARRRSGPGRRRRRSAAVRPGGPGADRSAGAGPPPSAAARCRGARCPSPGRGDRARSTGTLPRPPDARPRDTERTQLVAAHHAQLPTKERPPTVRPEIPSSAHLRRMRRTIAPGRRRASRCGRSAPSSTLWTTRAVTTSTGPDLAWW